MALKLFEDAQPLTALVIPLAAVVGAAVDKILQRITVTKFKPGEGLYITLIEPIHLDDLVGLIIFGVIAYVGYRAKNVIVTLFGLGALSGMVANEIKEAIDIYMPITA